MICYYYIKFMLEMQKPFEVLGYHTDIKKKYNKRKHESQTRQIKIAANL